MRPHLVSTGEAITRSDAGTPSGLLRFITCGSVDDGKSTLIGRILFEAGAVFEDQLEALDRDSQKFGTVEGARDFALLVDGLSAEREQGITIDVAYRYFATPRRSFIVADTPGHEQYTRNMATGASTADCAVILIDARMGVLPQTRRHSFIVSLVGVKRILVAVNKMDLVGFDQRVFDAIVEDYRLAVESLGFERIDFIPVSARDGDNISAVSERTPWYRGPALLAWLETVTTGSPHGGDDAGVLPVQYVNRPDHTFRGFAGTLVRGRIAAGDTVVSLPSNRRSRVTRIVTADGDLPSACSGQAVTLTLEDEIDTSRGNVLVVEAGLAGVQVRQNFEARLLVTGEQALQAGAHYEIKLGTATAQAVVARIHDALDIETFARKPADQLSMNGIGSVTLRLDRSVPVTSFADNRELGGFILIDRISRQTVAFGFVKLNAGPVGDGPSTTLSGRIVKALERLIGERGSALRTHRLQQASWRLASALTLLAVLYALSLPFPVVAAVLLVDVVVRPVLERAHHALWQVVQSLSGPPADLDQGEGI